MSATMETAREYSELNVLYNNLLNAQPGTPDPNYSADMKDAMATLQTALSDNTLSEAEVQVLDEIIARLDATGDDNAELFAEKLDSVIDTFVAQQVVNAGLVNDKANAEAERDQAVADKEQAESERDEYKALYEQAQKDAKELQETVTELTNKVTELENTIKTNAEAAAAKYAELETLYNKAIADYNKLYADYEKLLEENARIPSLEQQLVDAANQITALQASIAQSQEVILEYYYKHTGKTGTLEEALAYFETVTNSSSNQQGSSSADPEEPSYQP
jgi:chromosome segregation ATPase